MFLTQNHLEVSGTDGKPKNTIGVGSLHNRGPDMSVNLIMLGAGSREHRFMDKDGYNMILVTL